MYEHLNRLGRCGVTGGAGMLGSQIVFRLIDAKVPVRILDLVPPGEHQAEYRFTDIRDLSQVVEGFRGIDTMFHTAAMVWKPGTPQETFEAVNLDGTANVIEACRRTGVRKLVYTSTMDVVIDGKRPIVDGDESLPYAEASRDHYTRTKIEAERLVLRGCGPDLLTVAIRPVGMYGPGDKYHLGNMIGMIRKGFRMRIGDGSARYSVVYSGNAAHAHILAAERLVPGSKVCGSCYFITDDRPAENIFDFMEPFLQELGLSVPRFRIPFTLARYGAALLSALDRQSPINPFSLRIIGRTHTFSSDRARRELEYAPVVEKDEAIRRTVEWFRRNKF